MDASQDSYSTTRYANWDSGRHCYMASILPSNNYLNNSTLDPHIVTLLIGVETSHMVLSDDVYQSTRGIAVSAILFHIIWGVIFGFVISSLLRIQAYKNKTCKRMLDEK
jgi:hypothetical protein